LPVVLAALEKGGESRAGLVQLVWVVRRVRDLKWIEREMEVLREKAREGGVEVRVFVTREGGLEEGGEEDVGLVSGGKEIEVEDEKVGGVVDIDAADLNSPEKDSLDISTLATDSPGFSITYLGGAHPDLGAVVRDYIERCPASGGRIEVMGSGPPGIGSALRSVVAECNDGGKVRRGEEKADVGLYWDDRLL
jgi:ferric-chelate reductase